MKSRYLTGMVAGFLLAACLPSHAIVLRYQPKVGAVVKHKATMAGRMESSMEGAEQAIRMEMTVAVEYSEKILSQTADSTRVENQVLGGSLTMKLDEESQTLDVSSGRMVADVDHRGRLVKLVEADAPGGAQMQRMMGPGTEPWSIWYQFAAFPEGDIAVDGSWSDELRVPSVPGVPEVTVTFNSRLLALTAFRDRKCAKIRTSFEGPMALDLSDFGASTEEAAAGSMEATLHGDIVWYYDYESSVHVYAEGSVGMDMKMSMAQPEMTGGTMTAKMVMNMKTGLVQ